MENRAVFLPVLAGLLMGPAAHAEENPVPPPGHPAGFVALVGGSLGTDNVHVSATQSCFLFCVPISANRDTQYGKVGTAGIRLGYWGSGAYRLAGASLSLAHQTPAGMKAACAMTPWRSVRNCGPDRSC